ncbi:MAG: tyrosine-protein phosphatase [Pyrinomonadaceae bacterium]|nr:tyrosine-protein phosphatase [Pyrinomonadaceae bacterium]MBP6213903.1 tyrosine-protein phosphatase [Pyrinomonadaceae bacterium]
MNFLIKTAFACSITALCLTAAYSQSISPSKDLPNLYKVNAGIYRGGQPAEAGIKQLKAAGIRTIIDLRDDDDRAKKEGAWAKSAGLKFINIPLSNLLGPKDAKIDRILEQMTLSENQPVFIHCKRGSDRTGTAIAIYRISRESWTGEAANAEAKKFGFGWWQYWMKDYIDDYYRDFIKSHPAK